ncbi:MAG TPA: hypothetical protein VGP82_23620 [Ktedonobacterales bacterium]|nr:hypothetical protein [Ktedonobacterales bacterium]
MIANIQITGKCEEANESTYTNRSTGEVVTKSQLSLVIPSMRERILCELPVEKAPKPDTLDRWELEESWLVVSADGMRALAFERSNARAGEKPVGALVVFQAVDAREATPEERKQLQEARKAQKVQAKQRRAQRQAEKQAAREAAAAEASA